MEKDKQAPEATKPHPREEADVQKPQQEALEKPLQPSRHPDAPQPEQMRDIAVVLDNYDDIFSDFDPRPYSSREISADFVYEMKGRFLEDRKGRLEVRFSMPAGARNPESERVIKKRIKEYFGVQMKRKADEVEKRKRRGYMYLVIGATITGTVAATHFLSENPFLLMLTEIFLVPGWFSIWNGLDKVFEQAPDVSKQLEFLERFQKCNYIFMSIEGE